MMIPYTPPHRYTSATPLGDWLKTALAYLRFTQGELAAAIGVHRNTLNNWLLGARKPDKALLETSIGKIDELVETKRKAQLAELEAGFTKLQRH